MADYFDKADMELMLRGAPTEMPSIRVQASPPPQPPPHSPVIVLPQSGGLQEYWRIFRRNILFIAGVTVGCALLGLAITLPQAATYRAETALEVLSPNENMSTLGNLESPGGVSASPESYVETQARFLQSDELIERAALKMHLDQRPQFFSPTSWVSSLLNPILNRFRAAKPKPALNHDEMVERLKENLSIHNAALSRLIEIQVESSDPKFAAEFANTLATELIEQNLETRYQTAQKTAEWLAQPLKELRADLERSQDALQNYARSNGLVVGTEKGGTATEAQLRQIQEELAKAQADRASKQARYETAIAATPDSLPEVLDNGPLRDTRGRLTELQRQLAELNATFAPGYYKVKVVQAQVAELQTALKREQTSILERIKNEYHAAARLEGLLQASYEKLHQQVAGEAAVAARYDTQKSEVDANRAIYGPVMQKVKEAGIVSAIRASNIRIVSHAKAPRLPFKPKPLYHAGAGLLAGLFMASAIVLIREQTGRRIRFPGEISFDLNLAELGTIPSHRVNKMSRRPKTTVPMGEKNGGWNFRRKDQAGLIDWTNDGSAMAESFRSTLASLWFAGKKERRLRVFVITSPAAGEGKTTLVSQLGGVLANTNRRVLLIDGDVRRPRLHRAFGLNKSWGLGNILQSDRPIEDYSFREMFLKTEVPGLYVLPSGTGLGSIAGLRYHDRLTEFMARIRLEFHAVLIDTPPVLQFADARILGALADAVILVFRAGETSRDAAAASLRRLQEDGITVLGSILNDWDPKDTPYGYNAYAYGSYQDDKRV